MSRYSANYDHPEAAIQNTLTVDYILNAILHREFLSKN